MTGPAAGPGGAPLPGHEVEVLVPTGGDRRTLGVTLAGLAGQQVLPARVWVSDQSPGAAAVADPVVLGVARVLAHRGVDVRLVPHAGAEGVTENRHHLLGLATAPYVLMLDDDILLEPMALARMCDAMGRLRCGAVGMAMTGLTHAGDVRPQEHAAFEPVEGPVHPERVRKGEPGWERWRLHNAANPLHLASARGLGGGEPADVWTAYRVAWTSGCVLFDRSVLEAAGGFEFWRTIGRRGYGEDVVAQLRVMERAGAVALLPSEAHSLELPTAVPVRTTDAYASVLEVADREHARRRPYQEPGPEQAAG